MDSDSRANDDDVDKSARTTWSSLMAIGLHVQYEFNQTASRPNLRCILPIGKSAVYDERNIEEQVERPNWPQFRKRIMIFYKLQYPFLSSRQLEQRAKDAWVQFCNDQRIEDPKAEIRAGHESDETEFEEEEEENNPEKRHESEKEEEDMDEGGRRRRRAPLSHISLPQVIPPTPSTPMRSNEDEPDAQNQLEQEADRSSTAIDPNNNNVLSPIKSLMNSLVDETIMSLGKSLESTQEEEEEEEPADEQFASDTSSYLSSSQESHVLIIADNPLDDEMDAHDNVGNDGGESGL